MGNKRGKFLTIIIAAEFAISVFTVLALGYPNLVKEAYSSYPSWFISIVPIVGIIGIFEAIGLWKLKKWGVYLFGINTTIDLIAVLATMTNISTLVPSIVRLGIWTWAISRKWKYFS